MERKCQSFSQFLKGNKNSLKITNVSKTQEAGWRCSSWCQFENMSALQANVFIICCRGNSSSYFCSIPCISAVLRLQEPYTTHTLIWTHRLWGVHTEPPLVTNTSNLRPSDRRNCHEVNWSFLSQKATCKPCSNWHSLPKAPRSPQCQLHPCYQDIIVSLRLEQPLR